MEIVLVELADETGKVAMLEVFWQDGLGEFFALNSRSRSVSSDRDRSRRHEGGAFTSRTTKLSPSSPQRTMDA